MLRWNCCPHYWPSVKESTCGFSSQRGRLCRALRFTLLFDWANCWINSSVASELWCHDASVNRFNDFLQKKHGNPGMGIILVLYSLKRSRYEESFVSFCTEIEKIESPLYMKWNREWVYSVQWYTKWSNNLSSGQGTYTMQGLQYRPSIALYNGVRLYVASASYIKQIIIWPWMSRSINTKINRDIQQGIRHLSNLTWWF